MFGKMLVCWYGGVCFREDTEDCWAVFLIFHAFKADRACLYTFHITPLPQKNLPLLRS